MATIVSPRAELAVLRGITSKNKMIAGTLLATVSEDYFDAPESKEIFQAMQNHMARTGESPSFRLMLEDPDLSKESRLYFRNSDPTITTIEEARKAVKILNRYRQSRGLYEMAASIDKALQGGKLDLESLMENVSSKISSIRANKAHKDAFLHFGKNNNSMALVKDMLYGVDNDQTIPTGIKPFDEASGGLARGSLTTIGASSGGGKCCSLDTRIQLSTLVMELEDGSKLEGEPEDLVWCWRQGALVRCSLDQIYEQDEIEIDSDVILQQAFGASCG